MSEAPLSIAIHPSEFSEGLRSGLLQGLRQRRLPAKWLYHSPAQAQRWLAYHQAFSPSRNSRDGAALYGRAFARAAQTRGAGPLNTVGLGCGGGTKDARLLAALARARPGVAPLHYTPVDGSPALVAEAAGRVRRQHPTLRCHPLVADLTPGRAAAGGPGLGEWLAQTAGEMPRLFSCLGMLANFELQPFAAWLGGLVRRGDGLLLSADLSPGGFAKDAAPILAQYDNPPAREWYWGALAEVGFARADLALSVATTPPDAAGVWRIVVSARLQNEVALTLFGESLNFAQGEQLEVFFSNRLSLGALQNLLAQNGLRCEQPWLDPSGEEGIFLCEKI